MKTLIISLALMLTVPAFANNLKSFEVESQGCLFSDTRASCVFTNKQMFDTMCDLSILAKTENGLRIGSTRRVVIPAKRFQTIDAFSTEGNQIKSVEASGVCRILE